jgi:hypothetical protein
VTPFGLLSVFADQDRYADDRQHNDNDANPKAGHGDLLTIANIVPLGVGWKWD